MREVTDGFLLQMAEIAAGLIGLFLIGVFFYVETGERDRSASSAAATDVMDRYFRASTRIVLVLFAVPIGLSLTLVVMTPGWSQVLFVLLSVMLVAANVDSAVQVRSVGGIVGSRVLPMTEVWGSVAVVAIVTLPWILGGLHPGREDFAWAILLSFATGFLSIYAMVMSAFDISRAHRS